MRLLLTISLIIKSFFLFSQCDSIDLKIKKARTVSDYKVVVKMKSIIEKQKYKTTCDCGRFKYKKGDIVTLCRNQLPKPKKYE